MINDGVAIKIIGGIRMADITKTCQYCGEQIKAGAVKCKNCHSMLNVAEKQSQEQKSSWAGGLYDGKIANGLPNGFGTWTHEDGRSYVGEWVDGKKHGKGTFRYPSGIEYSGQWREDDYHSSSLDIIINNDPIEKKEVISKENYALLAPNRVDIRQVLEDGIHYLKTNYRSMPVILIASLILFSLTSYGVSKLSNSSKLNEEYQSGIQAYTEGNYFQALLIFETISINKTNYKDVESYIDLTKDEMNREAMEREIEEVHLSAERFNKALAAFSEGDFATASELFSSVITSDPNFDAAQEKLSAIDVIASGENYAKGNANFEEKKYTLALSSYKKVLEGNEYYEAAQAKIAEVNYLLAKEFFDKAGLSLKENDFSKARSNLNLALSYDPEYADATNLLARIDTLEKEYDLKQQEAETQLTAVEAPKNIEATPSGTGIATMGEKNAAKTALNYLNFMAFSYSGLVKQLEYEGYTYKEAVYGVDRCGADWNEQAAKKAQDYLDYSSFSQGGLIAQLEYEGFTRQQAEYGVRAVGY